MAPPIMSSLARRRKSLPTILCSASAHPAGLVLRQAVIGVVDFERIATLESIDVHHDIGATITDQAGEQNAGVTALQH